MKQQAAPEFVISQMRVQTMREITFFCVTSQPVPFADLDKDFDPMLGKLDAAKAQANLGETGPDIVRYYRTGAGEPDMRLMEVGIPVKPGMQPAGAAQVKVLPPYRCASLLLWGSLAHIVEAYEALQKGIQEAGLEHTGECQEWNYYFWGVESPHNLMGITMGVKLRGSGIASMDSMTHSQREGERNGL
jgi:effector-binding domain-containing protein